MRRHRHLGYDLMLLRLIAGRDPETGDHWRWRDPGFARKPLRFALQSGLATLAMLVTLMFVQSLSNAAIAAGLASSVVGIFITPANRTTRIRAVAGGHGVALALGALFSLLLFSGPVENFLGNAEFLRTLGYAIVVGLSMLLMAVTNTEHPPAAGTALGMASRQFDPLIFFSIIGAVVMLSILKLALRPYLQDLT